MRVAGNTQSSLEVRGPPLARYEGAVALAAASASSSSAPQLGQNAAAAGGVVPHSGHGAGAPGGGSPPATRDPTPASAAPS